MIDVHQTGLYDDLFDVNSLSSLGMRGYKYLNNSTLSTQNLTSQVPDLNYQVSHLSHSALLFDQRVSMGVLNTESLAGISLDSVSALLGISLASPSITELSSYF